jgi:hypothetical protein
LSAEQARATLEAFAGAESLDALDAGGLAAYVREAVHTRTVALRACRLAARKDAKQ